jgi:hypothetical protein
MVVCNDCRPEGYHEYIGTSEDDKPTDCAVYSTFYELDTDDKYYFTGETWAKIGGGA